MCERLKPRLRERSEARWTSQQLSFVVVKSGA